MSILKSVNKVYKSQNPSTYVSKVSEKMIKEATENKKIFFIDILKLPIKIFENSELLDLGCGAGQNTIQYDHMGANCTLVDYDKNSVMRARSLFKNHAKNKFNIINDNLFKFKTNKKFDFVVSNGVAHHTSDNIKNINLAIKFLKKGGFLILGHAEKNGFFQRNLQRYILNSLSANVDEITKISKLLFSENLNRAKKFGGRTIKEIIYDTYINPKIDALSFNEIKNLFKKNNLYLYSSDENNINLQATYGQKNFFWRFKAQRIFQEKNFMINALVNFSYKENPKIMNKNSKMLNEISKVQNNISQKLNDQTVQKFKKLNLTRDLKDYEKKIKKLKKDDIIDKKNTLKFLSEVNKILKILEESNKENKINKLKIILKKNQRLFTGHNGKGMNFFVGMKL